MFSQVMNMFFCKCKHEGQTNPVICYLPTCKKLAHVERNQTVIQGEYLDYCTGKKTILFVLTITVTATVDDKYTKGDSAVEQA